MKLEEVDLPASLLTKLLNEGYETVEELKKAKVFDILKELKLSKEEINKLFELTRGEAPVRTGKNMMEFISEDKGITLSSNNLNSLFETGIPIRRLTEICGESGSGKTQICMQLAVNVQLPKEQGGLDGECIYIDTEGAFHPHRFLNMINDNTPLFLNKIHLFRVFNHAELIALIRQLPDIILSKQQKVKLIVIDSIAYPFRLNTMNPQRRNLILPFLAQSLIRIATNHKLAVVVTNHVTETGQDGPWIPTLGTEWGSWCAHRLYVYRKQQFRLGYLYKNIDEKGVVPVQFCIKTKGITDPEGDETLKSDQQIGSEEITEKLENSWGDVKVEKVEDVWSQNLFIDNEENNIPLNELLPSETISSTNDNNHPHSQEVNPTIASSSVANNNNSNILQNQSIPLPTTTTTSSSPSSTVNNCKNVSVIQNKAMQLPTTPTALPSSSSSSSSSSSTSKVNSKNNNAAIKNRSIPTIAVITDNKHDIEMAESSDGTHHSTKNKIVIPQRTMESSKENNTEINSGTSRRSTRNKGKRKQVYYTEQQDDLEPMTVDTLNNNVIYESTSNNKEKETSKPQAMISNGQPNKKRKRNSKVNVSNEETLNKSDVKTRGKTQKEDISDWSESEIEDDLEFLSHFEEPF